MAEELKDTFGSAAYGGEGWQAREQQHKQEIGTIWAHCGIDSEWSTLRSVILYQPGSELSASAANPNAIQMLAPLDVAKARDEHQQLVETYQNQGVGVHLLTDIQEPSPNLMFCADLFAMTPQGAILARPASCVRAGEERHMARKLAELGIPILKTLTSHATFEGADLMWLNQEHVLLGQGLRTNAQAATQISATLSELGATVTQVDMPFGTMHFMGMLRIVDKDLAIAWPRRTSYSAVTALQSLEYRVVFVPENEETHHHRAFNFVTLGPRKILMVQDNPVTQAFYESHGIECITSPATELGKAAGAIGCLTGVLWRDSAGSDMAN